MLPFRAIAPGLMKELLMCQDNPNAVKVHRVRLDATIPVVLETGELQSNTVAGTCVHCDLLVLSTSDTLTTNASTLLLEPGMDPHVWFELVEPTVVISEQEELVS
jgi:hypothetical protein